MAKRLRNTNKFNTAFRLLKKYQSHHKNDLNATWLCAQTAYWMKHYNKSKYYYEYAMHSHPDNYYLLLDYR